MKASRGSIGQKGVGLSKEHVLGRKSKSVKPCHAGMVTMEGIKPIDEAAVKSAVEKIVQDTVNIPPGYNRQKYGLIIPDSAAKPVPASKLKAGFEKARDEIGQMIDEIVRTMKMDYYIKEIDVAISFSADGKFLGFGIGGATSMNIKIAPASSFPQDSVRKA